MEYPRKFEPCPQQLILFFFLRAGGYSCGFGGGKGVNGARKLGGGVWLGGRGAGLAFWY